MKTLKINVYAVTVLFIARIIRKRFLSRSVAKYKNRSIGSLIIRPCRNLRQSSALRFMRYLKRRFCLIHRTTTVCLATLISHHWCKILLFHFFPFAQGTKNIIIYLRSCVVILTRQRVFPLRKQYSIYCTKETPYL